MSFDVPWPPGGGLHIGQHGGAAAGGGRAARRAPAQQGPNPSSDIIATLWKALVTTRIRLGGFPATEAVGAERSFSNVFLLHKRTNFHKEQHRKFLITTKIWLGEWAVNTVDHWFFIRYTICVVPLEMIPSLVSHHLNKSH